MTIKVLRILALCLILALPMAGLRAQTECPTGSCILFPRFFAAEFESTGIAVFNPSNYPADVTFGFVASVDVEPFSVLVTSVETVPARGQIAKTAGELFPDNPIIDSPLVISSPTPGIVAYYQTFDSQFSFIDGAGEPLESTSLIFPVMPSANEGIAEITLYNPGERDTTVELNLRSFAGELLGAAKIVIPAGAFYRNLAHNAFPGANFSVASHITAISKAVNLFSQSHPVSGTSLFAGFSSYAPRGAFVDLAALNALSITQISTSGVMPFFRSGDQNASILSLANVEPAAVDVTITAISNNGSTLSSQSYNLGPHGGLRGLVQDVLPSLGSAPREGWVLIQATGRVTGAMIFGRSDSAGLAALPMQKSPMLEFVIPQVVQGGGSETEITLANATPNTSYVEFFVVGADGVTVAHNKLTVGPSKRISLPLDRIVPEVTEQSGGYIYVYASEPVFASAAIWTKGGQLLSSFTPQTVTVPFYPAPLTQFAVTGLITLNDRPAPGMRVLLSGPGDPITAVADISGHYAFSKLAPGEYSMSVDQFGFEFIPAQVDFELTTASKRQDFQGFMGTEAILVQPAAIPVGDEDVTATIFGKDFNETSQAFADSVTLQTIFVDSTQLQAVIPGFLLSGPLHFEVFVVTNDGLPNRRVSQSYPVVAFLDRPVLSSIRTEGDIMEGNPGTNVTLRGSGFLEGAIVKVNGSSEGIQVNFQGERQLVVFIPASYFAQGGVYPVTVVNPFPSNVESGVQLLTVNYPAPAVEGVVPGAIPVRLAVGAPPIKLDVFGFGFRRGAIVLFDNTPLVTTYCENDAFCLATHLFATVPSELLQESGFASIAVQNPAPSLASSQAVFVEIRGLQPTITSVVPGSASLLDSPFNYSIPIVVNGTNFGPQTQIRIYKVGSQDLPDFSDPNQVLSSNQILDTLNVSYLEALGEWRVEVANPPPGGGRSDAVSFIIDSGSLVSNPFLVSLTPNMVAAGGPSFTMILNGTNFKSGAYVLFYTTPLVTTVISDKQLRAEVPASLIQTGGRIPIRVINPDSGGTSNLLFLEIR